MFKWLAYLLVALFLIACGETDYAPSVSSVEEKPLFENCEKYVVDADNFEIKLAVDMDSLEVLSLAALGNGHFYLALDGDLEDPEIDWDNPLDSGAVLVKENGEFKNIVILDGSNRVVAVWQIKLPEGKSSSSADEPSEAPAEESSSSEELAESSSSEQEPTSSSSEEIVESSSAAEPESSSSEVVVESSCSEELVESSSSVEEPEEPSSSSAYEPQLPGADFSKRDDSFWATTSDVMSESKTAASIKFASSANLEFEGGKAILTTREIVGSLIGISGSWKAAGGFYFAGTFEAEDIVHLYQWNYTSGTPDAGYASDISQGMTFGRPFTARPKSFKVRYSYEHVANSSEDYPQKSLMYVMLVSADNKVVACGMHSDDDSVAEKIIQVNLNYGADPDGLLTSGYPVATDLTLGDGTEDVASIHVMFASSAYAHVVAGGAAGTGDKHRGGKNSMLILDSFELVYSEAD